MRCPERRVGLRKRRGHRLPGVVDQDLHRTEAPARRGKRLVQRGCVGDVGGERLQAIRRAERSCRAGEPRGVAAEHRDAGALRQQRLGDGEPDAATGAGHDRVPSGESARDTGAHPDPAACAARCWLRSSWLLPERYGSGHHCSA